MITTKLPIVAVNFTFACPDGMWIRRSDGSETWLHFLQVIGEVGDDEYERLKKIAMANGMTGMWYNATNGRNVYVDGQLVNG